MRGWAGLAFWAQEVGHTVHMVALIINGMHTMYDADTTYTVGLPSVAVRKTIEATCAATDARIA